jgi:hypothetical protein
MDNAIIDQTVKVRLREIHSRLSKAVLTPLKHAQTQVALRKP